MYVSPEDQPTKKIQLSKGSLKDFELSHGKLEDFELAPSTAEAFMPENLGGLPPEEMGMEAERQGFFPYIGNKLKSSVMGLGEMVTEMPQAIEAFANAPAVMLTESIIRRGVRKGEINPESADVLMREARNITPTRGLGKAIARVGEESIGKDLADSDFNEWLDKNKTKFSEQATRYDQAATEYIKTGQYGKALGAVAGGIAESLAPTIAAALVPGGWAALGAGTAAQQYDEVKDREDMTEGMKIANSLTQGVFEALFEKFGSREMGKVLTDIYKKSGKKGIMEAVTSPGVKSLIAKGYKKFGVWFATVHEGVSEALTTIGQNVTARITGEDPERKWNDGVMDSFLVGTGMGGFFAGVEQTAEKLRGGAPQQPIVPLDPDFEIKATINQYGEKLKFNSNVPLAEDQNPLIRFAKHKTEIINPDPNAPDYIIIQAGGVEGDPILAAYDYAKLQESEYAIGPDNKFIVRPVMLKEDQLKSNLNIPYAEWLQQEVNQFKQTQVQGQQMVVKAQAPVMEGQEITLGDKTFNVTFVDETGITLNEIDKQGNITGGELIVPPEDYEKVFGVPAAQSGQISPLNDQALPENVTDQGQVIPEQVTNTGQPAGNIPEQVQLPVNKKGEIEYDQITEPDMYAQGLTEEFGEDAPAILDELIAEQTAALEKAKKGSNAIERARKVKAVNAELTKLTHVKDIFNPPTAIAEGPSLEAPSASPVVEQPEPIEQATEQELARPEQSVQTPSTPDETAPVEAEMQEAGEVEQAQQPATEKSPEVELTKANAQVDTKPTEAQKEAGNYQKGHLKLYGLDISIENPVGSIRKGTNKKGNDWAIMLNNSYGYIRRTVSPEGNDQVDVFLGDNLDSDSVYIIDQIDPETGKWDEHKVMMGFNSAQDAKDNYLANYEPGWKGLGDITKMSVENFKQWVFDKEATQKPLAYKQETPETKKEPWQMTREEYGEEYWNNLSDNEKFKWNDPSLTKEEVQKMNDDVVAPHIRAIKQALSQGKQVPDNVLADYPELKNSTVEEQETDQEGKEGTGETEFAGESLENTPSTRSLREFNKGDHVKNIKTGNEYEVVSVPKTGDVSLKKLGEKQIKNFNGKLTQWVPIQKEIKAKGVKRTVKFGPDSQKGKLLARMPQTFKEFVLQFFVRGGRVSHADFLRYVGWKAGKKEGFIWAVKGSADGKTEQGKAFDSFWEDVPEEWGRRGGTEDTNEIADILKTYPSITQMMDELKRLQSTDESVPDRNMPSPEELGAAVSDADIEDDLSNHEDEVVGRLDDVWDNPDYQIIFDKYSTDKGLDVDKLLTDLNNNPEGISTLTPFGLNNKELTTLKNYLEDEQSRRKESQVSENIQGFDKDQSPDRKEDSSGSDQGNRVRGTAEEGEGNEVVIPGSETGDLRDSVVAYFGSQNIDYQKSPISFMEVHLKDGRIFFFNNEREWTNNKGPAKYIEITPKQPKDDIDKLNDLFEEKPKETPASKQQSPYSPIQQKQIDKINKEYSEQIAKKEAAIVQAEKDMREALLKADNRNGLFGDTNPVEKDEIIKRDEQGFTYDEAAQARVRKPFEEKMAELRKEIEELKLEQKGKIESVIKQQDLFADIPAEPVDSKPIDKESLPKLDDFGQKIGGARKDMEITRTARDTDSLPAWRRKYHYANADGTLNLGAPVDTSKPFIVQWAKDIASWAGKRTVYRPVTTIDTRETKVFNSEEEAEAYIPIYEVWKQNFRVRKVGDNYAITKTSSTNKVVEYGTFPTEEEANTYMYSTEGATSLLNHKREDFSIPALDKVERTGKDWRKSKDISTEEFMETFGFRGGEFGNWVKPEERRVMLNAAYDSFMDLAELLGVPPRSLSLSGELSIAFGARGVKGAAAHFEPDRAVINLTRMNGAGSLAHEWAHALDNYFGLQAAKKDYSRNDKGKVIAGKVMRTTLLSVRGMRKELSEIFDKIIEATQEKSVTRKMGVEEKQKSFDKFQKSVQREADDLIKKFTNGVRRYQYNRKTKQREDVVIKATPDQIKKAKNIVDKIIAGEGTKPTWERIPESKSRFGDYSYISPEMLALDALHKEVFGKTGLKRDGAGFYNLGYYGDRMYRAKETLDKALAGESETLNVPTDFLKVSKEFDKSRANPYWATKIEMFARAFEYFIETKLLDQNVRADYLQYDKAPVYDAVYGKNPYPQGEERAEINKLFDEFFKEVKVKTDEKGNEVLYRVIGERGATAVEGLLDYLNVARQMEKAGKSPKEIFLATGWERGKDGKWRHETRDIELKKDIDFIGKLKTQNEAYTEEVLLTDIIEDEELFNSYPELKEVKLTFYNYGSHPELTGTGAFSNFTQKVIGIGTENMAGTKRSGSFFPGRTLQMGSRTISGHDLGYRALYAYDRDSLKSVLSHEIQHYIQRIEGFAEGTTTVDSGTGRRKDLVYKNAAGEVESRNVQQRTKLTPEERKAIMLSETEDVSRDQQIVIRNEFDRQENANTVRAQITALSEEFNTPVIVVETKEDLPDDVKTDAKNKGIWNDRITGVYDSGKVYVVLDALSQGYDDAVTEARKVILHEVVAHKGLPAMLGQEAYDNLLDDIYDSIPEDDRRLLEYDYNTKDKRTIATEYLADMAENDVNPSLFQRIIAKVRDILHKLFNIGYTENDVYDMLRRSAENLRKQKRANAEFAGEYLERTQDITQTPAFKKWFGDSKVVDENGRPLVVYHGSPNTFDTFNLDKVGAQGSTEGHGFYFTADREIAQGYAERRDQGEGKLYEVYLKIENPYSNEKRTITKTDVRKILSLLHKKDPEYALSNYGDIAYEGLNKVLNIAVESENEAETDTDLIGSLVNGGIAPLESVLKAVYDITGKDGVITSWENGTPIFVTASPNQIKSATGNKGTFDSNNPNILYSTNKPSDRFAGDWLEQQPEVGPNPELLKSAAQIYAERQAKGNISETVQGIREYIQDMNLPVRKFEEDVLKRGGRQDNDSKPYRDMNLSFGRQEKLYTDYFDKKMKPIFRAIAAIKKAGVRGEEILPYVIAKHAVERNPIMRGEALRAWVDGHQDATADEIEAKRAELKDLDYSGVKSFDGKNEYENPDALARDIVKAFEATIDKSLIDNFWNSVRTATSATLDTWEQGNQISAEQKKKYLEQYRYFVPLRGWRHGAAKELIYSKGEGFSKSLQKAQGRKSLADNPLAYILSVQFQAISEQVDNEVKTSMYNLILKNLKNPEINELVTVKKLYYVKIKHADGTEEWEPTDQRPAEELFKSGDAKTKIYQEHERLRKFRHAKEHEVIVHKPGGDAVIVFKKTQLSTAHALNKQNYIYRTVFGNIYDARDINKALSLLGSMNNTLKALYTSWNVVFPFTNFMRDFQEASITQSIKQGTGLKVMANYKGAFPAVIRNLRGKPDLNNEYDRDLQDFYTLGGATGYTHTKTIEDIEKDVNREVDILVGRGTVLGSMKNGFRETMRAVETWNKVFEDATRFSVYLSSLAAGNSKQDAAIDAKEASVNFNRKGKGSKAWDSWFAFFNVALQSLQKNFKLAKDHSGKFTAVAGSFVMLGFLEAMMNALTDDDDKDSAYYNINPWMRQNYLLIPNLPKLLTSGEKGNKYLSIPLPQFWRGFKSIGAIAFDIATRRMSVKDGVMSALGNFGSGLLPVDLGGFYKSGEFSWAPVFPTVLKPIVEVAENKNYMGYAIKNEPFTREQKKDLANAGLGKTNVSPAAKYLTDMLFRWGGGKGKYKYYYDQEKGERGKVSGALDINPSAIEHLLKGYTGGTGTGISDLFTTIIQATSPDQDIDFRNIPFVNRFIRTVPEAKWNIISEYYNLRDDTRSYSKLEKDAIKDAETTGDWSTVTAMYGNEYLQRYQETFASFEGELDDAMKMKDFDLVEGNRLSVEIMERAIAEIKELKREYGKK